MKQSLKIGFVALVVAAIAASGMAFAQSGGTDDTVPPAGDTQVERSALERGFEGRGGHHGMRGGPGHLDQVADLLGIDDPQVIVDGLEAGDTLADIAIANGSSGAAVVDSLVADLAEKLDGAVADEKITQEKADEILAQATEKITTMVNSTQEEIQATREAERAEHEAERQARRAERQETLESVVGVPFEDIQAALAEGETTLAEYAAANGNQLSLEDLVDGLVAPAAADLADKVADGTLTQEKADECLADITERITERVQSLPGDGPGFGDHGGRRGPGRGGPGGGPGFGGGDFAPPAENVSLSA